MAIDSVDTLLTVIRRTQIFAPDQVDEIVRELVPHFVDPRELADHLIRIEWLTAYQYETLFSGEWDMLAIGTYTLAGIGVGATFTAVTGNKFRAAATLTADADYAHTIALSAGVEETAEVWLGWVIAAAAIAAAVQVTHIHYFAMAD